MRVWDFGLEVLPRAQNVRETSSGHVLARPGQAYALRLRNHGPLRCVVHVEVDGRTVTGGGLVLNPFSKTDLERPIEGDSGRFTVVPEGDESVFGPDGGRDNPALGLIEARFRRELPNESSARALPTSTYQYPHLGPEGGIPPRIIRTSPLLPPLPPRVTALRAMEPSSGVRVPDARFGHALDEVERAAGTGLTGRSEQEFEPISLGPLEDEETVLRLRLVIGSEAAIEAAMHEGTADDALRSAGPERPAPRP
jgi:hypothetical protein